MNILLLMIISGTIPLIFFVFIASSRRDKSNPSGMVLLLKISILFFIIPFQLLGNFFFDFLVEVRTNIGWYSLFKSIRLRGWYKPLLVGKTVYIISYRMIYFSGFVIVCFMIVSLVWWYHFYSYKRTLIKKTNQCNDINHDVLESIESYPELKLKKSINIIVVENISSPVTVGLLNPIIILPKLKYSKEDLNMIILHEMIHIQHKDIFWKYLCVIICAFYWYLPFSWFLMKEYGKYSELRCDQKCLKYMTEKQKKEYAILLINQAISKKNSHNPIASLAVTKSLTERRIRTMYEKKTKRVYVTVLTIVAFVLSCSTVLAYERPWTQDSTYYEPKTDYYEGEWDQLIQADEEIAKLDFTQSDNIFVDKEGNISVFTSEEFVNKSCKHLYETGNHYKHTKNGKGGCYVKCYKVKKCKKCSHVANRTLLSSHYYSKCPH